MEDEDFNEQPPRGFRKWIAETRRYWGDVYLTNPLLRHLIHEPLFLGAVLISVTIALAVAVMLPKRWDPTPPGFSKAIRVSLLDYVQAWALRRAGAKALRAGDWDDAIASYRGAIANNLADPSAIRGLLEALRDAPPCRSSNLGVVFVTSELLLEISHTNRADVLLIADVLERHRIADAALSHLKPWADNLTPAEDLVWTRALLGTGQISAFLNRWNAHPERYRDDPTLRLYRAAVDAGWGSVEEAVAGLDTLRQALSQPATQATAARLLGAAALQRDDLPAFDTALKALLQLNSAMAQDHALWWELLARNGRRAEAIELAKAYGPIPPPTAVELIQLTRTWFALGLDELAITTLRDHAGRFGQSTEVWATYLDLLMLRNDWNEVRRVAALLRSNITARDELLPVTLYADIRADLAEGRLTVVRDSLSKLRAARLPNPRLALRFAAGLNSAGEFDTAWHILSQLATPLESSPDYWLEVIFCTRGRKDIPGMRQAADRLAEISPNNASAQTLRLITLLGARELPGEALAISLRLMNAGSRSASTLINHAMALLANQRAEEAIAILDPLASRNSLSEDETNSLRVALADAYAQLDRPAEALRIGLQADASVLLPPQADWFRKLLEECRRKSDSATGPSRP